MTYTVGEAAQAAGVTPRAVRLYESKGLCASANRTASGYRVFTEADVANLRFVRCGRHLGLSLDAIAEILALSNQGASPCERTHALMAQRLDEIDAAIAELQQVRARIAAAQTADVASVPAARCAVIEHATGGSNLEHSS